MFINKKEQRYYSILSLHKLFAVSSAALLASLLWLILDDYSAEWKYWQRKFIALENVKLPKSTLPLLKNTPRYSNKLSGHFQERSPVEAVSDFIRDLPLLDFLNPSLKIEQVVAGEFTFDLNFARAARVDRCISCHIPLTDPAYERGTLPLKTHPKNNLYISFDSPHPPLTFGCTICHQGRDRGTSFLSSAHSPGTPEKLAKWQKSYEWEPLKFWNFPMLPSRYIESSCLKCHLKESSLDGAGNLNEGRKLIKKLGCRGCHIIPGEESFRKPGPSLKKIASKLKREWVKNWIMAPKKAVRHANMPLFFPPEGALSAEESAERIDAMVEFLFFQSEEYDLPALTPSGNHEHGRELFASIGCTACHPIPGEDNEFQKGHYPAISLDNLKGKVNRKWLFSWLKSPEKFAPETQMPNFRLSDREASDLTGYLLDWKSKTGMGAEREATPKDNREKQRETPREKGIKAELGKKLVSRYGCFGCHDIHGFENSPPAGPDLSAVGAKNLRSFDFGRMKDQIENSRHSWLFQKIKNPRGFSIKKRGEDESLIMPAYDLTYRETKSIVTYLLGLTAEQIPARWKRELGPEEKITKDALRIIDNRKCLACHTLDGKGGIIKNRKEFSRKDNAHLLPPSLDGEGEMVQSQWLFSFLKNPSPVRHWLRVRMPTFNLSDKEVETLVTFFSVSGGRESLFERPENEISKSEIKKGKEIFTLLKCDSCHRREDRKIIGQAEIGPDLTLAKNRLRKEWIRRWLEEPQSIKKGTRMPTNWIKVKRRGKTRYILPPSLKSILGGDVKKQISAVTAYIYTL